jgi:hypothetical protein
VQAAIGPTVREAEDLETAKDSNVALYLKLGFKVVGEWWDSPKEDPISGPCSTKIENGPDEVPVTTGSTSLYVYWLNMAALGQ